MTVHSSTQSSPIRVAVVGAGMGGLVLALFIQKYCPAIQVDIYESTAGLTEVGVGIGMYPRVWEVVRFLGLEADILEASGDVPFHPVRLVKGDQPEGIFFHEQSPRLRTFHRSALQGVFVKNLRNQSSAIHFSKRLVSYTDPSLTSGASGTNPITLHFKDGSSATCDLLVGSDGIRSTIRRQMYTHLMEEAALNGEVEKARELQQMVEPVWSGSVAYRGLVPVSTLSEEQLKEAMKPTIRLGKNQHLVSYPILGDTMINIVGTVHTPGGEGTTYSGPWATPVTAEEVVSKYATWEPAVPALLKNIQNPLLWAINRVRKLPTYVHERVAIIGDAAHAMTPFQAAGASAAIEDGFILASVLSHPDMDVTHLPAALKIFDEIRRPFAQGVQRASDENGHLFQLHRVGWENITPAESAAGAFPPEWLAVVAQRLEEEGEWALTAGSITADRERALEMVDKVFATSGQHKDGAPPTLSVHL